MVNLKNLKKVFLTDEVETTAINDVSLEINQGDFVAITGPSGCGKSTLLNILGLLDGPSSGNYYFEGTDISQYPEKKRASLRKGKVGFVFQSFNLIDDLTVYENVELPLHYQGVPKDERRQKIESVLEKMDILHRKDHFPRQLSGGQQQRVAIARAVVSNPSFILADEPTGNLDSKNGKEVMNILTQLNKEGSTIIMVTHTESDVQYANRVIRLFDGKVESDNLRKAS